MTNKGQQTPQKQMSPTIFEPKSCRRFIVDFDGIDSFLVSKVELPKLTFSNGALGSGLPAKLYLHCPVNPSTEKQVQDAMVKQGNGNLSDCIVKFIDPVGTVINTWTFLNTKIASAEFTPPDYNSNELMQCVLSFRFNGIKFD